MKGNDMKGDTQKVYICDCSELSHSMRFLFDEDTDYEFCYVEFGMRGKDAQGFFRRLWEGIKYTFTGEYPFTELVFTRPQVQEMRKHIDQGLKRKCTRPQGRVTMKEWNKK